MTDFIEEDRLKGQLTEPSTFYPCISLVKKYNYADYVSWGNDIRYELLDGVPYMMAGANERHQWVSNHILDQLNNKLRGKPCVPYHPPMDVRLFYEEDESDTTTVQPDLMIVCDESQIKGLNYCKGPPQVIIEITSASTESVDFGKKRFLYERAKVPEYWVVTENRVYIYTFENKAYNKAYKEEIIFLGESNSIQFRTLEGIFIDFSEIIFRYQN